MLFAVLLHIFVAQALGLAAGGLHRRENRWTSSSLWSYVSIAALLVVPLSLYFNLVEPAWWFHYTFDAPPWHGFYAAGHLGAVFLGATILIAISRLVEQGRSAPLAAGLAVTVATAVGLATMFDERVSTLGSFADFVEGRAQPLLQTPFAFLLGGALSVVALSLVVAVSRLRMLHAAAPGRLRAAPSVVRDGFTNPLPDRDPVASGKNKKTAAKAKPGAAKKKASGKAGAPIR